MRLYHVPENALIEIVAAVSACYAFNLVFKTGPKRVSRNCITFTLRVSDSSGRGARRSATGRKMVAACWHVHRDVMERIFSDYPQCRLQSMLADYRGAADFFETFHATGANNIGSMASPRRIDEACNCEAFELSRVQNSIVAKLNDKYADTKPKPHPSVLVSGAYFCS